MAAMKARIEQWVALYVRLSRDDDNEGDSNSIAHQIDILTKYAKDHGITNYKIYKDDGYSGVSFNRPGFQEMLSDIDDGLVSMVVVKDMSRFGRNYLEVGMFTEIRFPEKGVRFIAVNDGVDSEREDNDFTPFRNIINEWYAKDTSKKIRAVFRAKGMSGKRLSTQAPYGYVKDGEGNLLVDEETAPVVRLIFQLAAEGEGPGKIARRLREMEIITPRTLAFQRTGRTDHYDPEHPCHWESGTIVNMLEQMTYLGHTVNFKTTKKSYKSKKQIENPPDKWAVFENTHEALISQEQWEIVQKNRESRRRPTKMGDMGMFSGLLYCADCGHRLNLNRTKSWLPEQNNYTCGIYKQKKGRCSAHYIRSVVLEQLVLENLREVISFAREREDEFVQLAMENKMASQLAEQAQAKRLFEQQTRRIAEIDNIIKRLYEDNITGKLNDERFAKMTADYEQEQAALQDSTDALRNSVEQAEQQSVNMDSFLKIVRKYTVPDKLFPELLHAFVEKIVVHEADKSSGHRTQQIDIYYNFIGEIPFSHALDKKEPA
jgi:site-specific DNA recombinase